MPDGAKEGDLILIPGDLHIPDKLPTYAEALQDAIARHGDDETMLYMYVNHFLAPLYDPQNKEVIDAELD